VGALFAIIMVVAIYSVHLQNGFNNMAGGYEFQLLLLVCSVGLSLVGPGKFSLHKKICAK
jgi:putative oxidoreductase